MTNIEKFAAYERKIRPFMMNLNPWVATFLFTYGRKLFLKSLINSVHKLPCNVSPRNETKYKFWEIEFGNNLFNAAGMFKHGKGYELCAYQGAGAFLAGTTTSSYRKGNYKSCIAHPFAAFPVSEAAINWMGLPNEGHERVARRLSSIEKLRGCPLGASVAASPDDYGITALSNLVTGMKNYEKAGVDFIELNESCPNVPHECSDDLVSGLDKSMVERLEYISKEFLKKRSRNLPVIAKYSVDTSPDSIPALLDILLELGFDGINIGNTSTDYDFIEQNLIDKEINIFSYFTRKFGGGVSGYPIKIKSLQLATLAADYLLKQSNKREFHVIRTGGIDCKHDVIESNNAGISLNQWFTGYFESFSQYGHLLYGFEKMPEN